MEKKVSESVQKKKKYDDTEDLNIKKVAYSRSKSQTILLYSLIIIFIFTLSYTTIEIISRYSNKRKNNTEIIEVMSNKDRVVIINNGKINQVLTNDSFKEDENELIIERINSIELFSNNNTNRNSNILYNVRYNITKNTFNNELFKKNGSQIKVKFSYSKDGIDWTYIDNVISIPESTISPMEENYYDITGIETNLKIMTNLKLEAEKDSSNKIYWRSETVFKKTDIENIDGELDANFKIEYKEWN